jgi:hypothetical protein
MIHHSELRTTSSSTATDLMLTASHAVAAVLPTPSSRRNFVGGVLDPRVLLALPRSTSLNNLRNALPALQELIGEQRARELDVKFGSLQPVREISSKGNVSGVKPWECDQNGKPLTHPNLVAIPDVQGNMPNLSDSNLVSSVDLEALKRGEKSYIWAMSKTGRLLVGEYLCVGFEVAKNKPKYLGHVTFFSGGPGRICGELGYDSVEERFVINRMSGRYSRYKDRTPEALKEVAKLFEAAGLQVRVDGHSTKTTLDPLRRPSLDPRFDGQVSAPSVAAVLCHVPEEPVAQRVSPYLHTPP